MATKTDIVNIALRRIGANRISNLDTETSKEGVAARDIYDEARKDLLSQHHWNFAVKRAELTASDTDPEFGYDYAYPLPEDFIRLVSAHPHDDDDATVPYRLEFQDSDDRVLITNSNQIFIKYIFDLDDPNLMSAAFRDVLAYRLARDFAGAISKSAAAGELMERAYQRSLSKAKNIDGTEDWPEKLAEGDWITSRWPDTSRA